MEWIKDIDKNQHVANAKAVERTPRGLFLFLQTLGVIGLYILATLGLSFIAAPLMRWVSGLSENMFLIQTLNFSLVGLALSFSAMILGVIFWVRFIEKRKARTIGFEGRQKLKRYITGFLLGIISMTIVAVLLLIIGNSSLDNAFLPISGTAALPFVLIVLAGWLVQGAAEEVFIQGWLMPKAVKTFGIIIGVLISTTVFALLHLGNNGISLLPLINLALYGTFAAVYALYEEGILGVCGFHAAWNFSQGNIFGFLVSGGATPGGSILGIRAAQGNIINGGAFGPEGGLVVTVILVVGIIILVNLHRKKAMLDNAM